MCETRFVTPPSMLFNRGNQLGILFVSFEDFWSKLSSLLKDSNTIIFTSELSQRSTSCRPSLASLHGECGCGCPTKEINGNWRTSICHSHERGIPKVACPNKRRERGREERRTLLIGECPFRTMFSMVPALPIQDIPCMHH